MDNFDFEKVNYTPPSSKKSVRHLPSLIGWDSEAYYDGEPFIFCTSDGDIVGYYDLFSYLFSYSHRGRHYITWNLSYEVGHLVRHLPKENLDELRSKKGRTEYQGYVYTDIPGKKFTISQRGKGKHSVCVTFWDALHFYGTSLQRAAEIYLNQSKLDMDVSQFTRSFVGALWDDIAKYCIQDAYLTKCLGDFIVDGLRDVGIEVCSLYSPASISSKYFEKYCGRQDVGFYWRNERDVLRFACEAYSGGKFEMTSRGYAPYGVEYDIKSAYPAEMRNLLDLKYSKLVRDRNYREDAEYGFLEVRFNHPDNFWPPHPIPIKRGNTNLYPSAFGTGIKKTVTKDEYDYLVSHGFNVKILDGYWFIFTYKRYPYRKTIDFLYSQKDEMKGVNNFWYNFYKVMLNSMYGKFVQLTDVGDGTLKAGMDWNPIYGAIITARVRVRMAEMQYSYPSVVAVHTDAVITTEDIPLETGKDLGDWDKEIEGELILLQTGIYQLGDKVATRGFRLEQGQTWFTKLRGVPPNTTKLKLPQEEILSWRAATDRGQPELINRPVTVWKELDLNGDSKRLWGNMDAEDLLSFMEYGFPHFV